MSFEFRPSNMHRRASCPASARMEAQCAEPPESEEASEGSLMHRAFNGEDVKLTEEQIYCLRIANESMNEIARQAATMAGSAEWYGQYWEQKLTHGDFSGTPDRLLIHPSGLAVIADLKCGRLAVEKASDNLQLAAYAVLAEKTFDATSAFVAIIQPRLKAGERLTMAYYDAAGLAAAELEIDRIIDACMQPDAPLRASDRACRYCKAAAAMTCPAYLERFAALATIPERDSIATLDTPELQKFFHACKAAFQIWDSVLAEFSKRVEAGEVPGYYMKPTGETREVTDIVAAYQAFAAYFENLGGIDAARFTACTKLSLTELAEYARELTGFPQNKAKRLVAELLNQWIARKEKRPTPTQEEA